jgi:hypothetical protein
MVKATGKYLLATGSDTDWANVLSNWDITFSQLNNCIYDISGIPLIDDASLNTNNLNKIDISAKVPQLSPFRAYWVDISGIIEDYTIFYMTEDTSYNINEFYIDDIIGRTSYDSDISENNIRAVTMAQAVTTIAEQTFASLPNLTRVNVPKTVTTIGTKAFYDCSNLLAVTFEENSQLNTIGSSAFQGTTNLSAITIPSGVTSIGELAFEFAGFTSTTIPSGITTLPDGVFANMPNLTTVIFEADSLLNIIGNSVFSSSENLTTITIPSGVTSIGQSAFDSVSNLNTVIFEADSSLNIIGNGAFTSTTSLTSISIPPLVTSIGSSAFEGSGLTSISIPPSVITIGASAFKQASALAMVILAKDYSLTSIGDYMFQYCVALTSIYIPHYITSIGSNAFQGSDLTYIFRTDSVFKANYLLGTIEDNAFNSATKLTSITIPRNVTSIGPNVFLGSSLTHAIVNIDKLGTSNFPTNTGDNQTFGGKNGVTITGYNILNGTGTLEKASVTSLGGAISIIEGYSIIGFEAFKNAVLPRTKIIIGKSVTEIGSSAFYDMGALSSVIFETDSSLNTIGSAAFYSNTDLTSITIPPLVTNIGNQAFIACSTLSQVTFNGSTIPSDISSNTFPSKQSQNITAYYTQDLSQNYIDILEATFSTVTNSAISKFTLQDYSVVQINIHGSLSQSSYSSQISDITKIIEIDIGNNVTSIEDSAFNGANNLTVVTIPQSVTSIESNAFSNSGLNTVNMTESTSTQLGLAGWYDYTVSPPVGPNGEQSMEVQSLFGLNNYSFFGATNVNIYHPILLGL